MSTYNLKQDRELRATSGSGEEYVWGPPDKHPAAESSTDVFILIFEERTKELSSLSLYFFLNILYLFWEAN